MGNIFLTVALAMALYVLFIYPLSGDVCLAEALLAGLGYGIDLAMAFFTWFLGVIFLIVAYLLSIDERSGALGLSFGYAALLNAIFIISIFTTIKPGRFCPSMPGLESLLLTIIVLMVLVVTMLLLGIAAAKRF